MFHFLARIEVLLPGFPGAHDQGVFGLATCSLVRTDRLIVVDPGHFGRKPYLYESLKSRKLSPEDIDIVFLTELHWDHIMNYEMFTNARILAPKEDWEYLANEPPLPNVRYSKHTAQNLKEDGVELVSKEGPLARDVKIIRVVGHSPGHTALLVNTSNGPTCVSGDAIHNGRTYLTEHESIITMGGRQEDADNSIRKIKKMAKIIYPGHDAPFIGKGNSIEYLNHPKMIVRTFLPDGRDLNTSIGFERAPKEGL